MSNLMQDPFYGPILFQIESQILASHREAQTQNLRLTDSQVRSILNKVRKTSAGGKTQLDVSSERGVILKKLHQAVVGLWAELLVESEDGQSCLPLQEWVQAIKAIEDSIRVRSGGPGSSDYLVYLEGFIAQATRATP